MRLASEYGCDIVCYGHTHISKIKQLDNILLINPGSARFPRDGKSPSYAILNIEDDIVDAEIVFQEDWDF